jgi:hypothetical protein
MPSKAAVYVLAVPLLILKRLLSDLRLGLYSLNLGLVQRLM